MPHWKGHCVPRQGCYPLLQEVFVAGHRWAPVLCSLDCSKEEKVASWYRSASKHSCWRCKQCFSLKLFCITCWPYNHWTREIWRGRSPFVVGSTTQRQCLLMTLRCHAVFRESAALCPCTVLLGPVLSYAELARSFDGGLESWFRIPNSLILVNLTNPHFANRTKILTVCVLLSNLGLLVVWFKPGQVQATAGGCGTQERGSVWLEQSGCSSLFLYLSPQRLFYLQIVVWCSYTNHPDLTHLSSQVSYLTASLSPEVVSWAFSELGKHSQVSRNFHSKLLTSSLSVVLLRSMSVCSGCLWGKSKGNFVSYLCSWIVLLLNNLFY